MEGDNDITAIEADILMGRVAPSDGDGDDNNNANNDDDATACVEKVPIHRIAHK